MNNTQSLSSALPGIQKITHSRNGGGDDLNALLHDLLATREVRRLLITLVPEFLNVWAGGSFWKQTISKLAGHVLGRQLSRPEDALENQEIRQLLESREFVQSLAGHIPDWLALIKDAAAAFGRTLSDLPAEKQKALLEKLMGEINQGHSGDLLTSLARMVNQVHRADPLFFARVLAPGFQKWVEAVDFGELKEALENAGPDIRALVTMANETIWEYPSKVVLLLSLLPSLVNVISAAGQISLARLNEVPPDMLADIVLAFIKEIDAKALARLGDELSEVIRKIHTGSALLGEPGAPQMPKVFNETIGRMMGELDPALFWKARIALAELQSVGEQALAAAAQGRPEFRREGSLRSPELMNIRLRNRLHKLSLWENLEDEELANALARQLSGYDAQAAAEVCNQWMRLALRLYYRKPGVCAEFLRQFLGALDVDALAKTTRGVFTGMGADLRPAARSVVPDLVTFVCNTLQPLDDEHEDRAARAREAVRALLTVEEV